MFDNTSVIFIPREHLKAKKEDQLLRREKTQEIKKSWIRFLTEISAEHA